MRTLLLILLFSFSLFGEVIEKFHTDLAVTNNKKVFVSEEIVYNFKGLSRHGIYLDIPKNNTKLSNLKVTQDGYVTSFKIFRKKDFYRIRIGSPERYVTGKVDYKVSFNLSGQIVRKYQGKNAIIFDFIGTGWKVPILNASGRLFLPKKLQNRVTFRGFRGRFGTTNKVDVENSGDSLRFETQNLQPHEGVTLLVSFDPTLMAASKKPSLAYYKNPLYYLFISPILALFYFFAKRYNIFGDIGSIAPKYHPPKDLTVLEAGLLKDNFVDFEEIKPTILELANLGYLKFETIDGVQYLKRLKTDTNNLTRDQQMVFDEIFDMGELIPNKELTINQNLYDRLKNYLHDSIVQKGYFGSKVSTARETFSFVIISAGLLTVGGFLYYIFRESGFEALFPIGIASFFIVMGIVNLVGAIKSKNISTILFFTIWILFSLFFLTMSIQSKDLTISIGLMILIIAIGAYLIYRRINTLTFQGVLAKRHLLGLKEFINRAEKDKIKFFLKEDSHYLDKLLPYAVLFGVNKHWLKLYEELNAPMPTWYDGNIYDFSHFDFDPRPYTPSSINQFDGYTPNSIDIDPGDFTDFGGFSGGGFGGGGGDSW